MSPKEKIKANPWLFILIAMPLPILALGYSLYKYSSARVNFSALNKQMIERQNRVLANDAISVATELSHLLNESARDVETLSLLPETGNSVLEFHYLHTGEVTVEDPRDDSVTTQELPLYSRLSVFDAKGKERIRIENGKTKPLRAAGECNGLSLCDGESLQNIVHSPPGTLHYGRLQRWYVPEGQTEDFSESHFPVFYRTRDRIYLLGIDYRFFRHIMALPTFPYERKRDLVHSYRNGNYIYLVDDAYHLIGHPKISHVTGIDRATGQRVTPMQTDADEGTHPLNFQKYQGDKLRDYFNRLMNRSFLSKTVDVFQAANLGGTKRVLSVAPTLLKRGQFAQSGIFGHTVLGCNVDYFEEPKEQYVPYY